MKCRTEFGKNEEIILEPVKDIFVPAPTTDVPHKPEYVYAGSVGEYWDQDGPYTLLPTYTSPDYASNLLKL